MTRESVLTRGDLDAVEDARDRLEDAAAAVDLLIVKARLQNDSRRVRVLRTALGDLDRCARLVGEAFR